MVTIEGALFTMISKHEICKDNIYENKFIEGS
jgi:hypothetical protein